MTELTEGMHRLINPWHLTITVNDEERTQEFPPLVDMLAARVSPDNNPSGGGGASVATRNVMDIKSLDLLMHIQDVTRAWLNEWHVTSARELKLDLRGYWDRLNTLHASGGMDETTYGHLATYPDTWAQKIWDLIEPPLRVTLRGVECPRCNRHKLVTDTGETTDNLIILWRDRQEPTAECQWADCEAIWVGDSGLEALGRQAGFEVDVEALIAAKAARHG